MKEVPDVTTMAGKGSHSAPDAPHRNGFARCRVEVKDSQLMGRVVRAKSARYAAFCNPDIGMKPPAAMIIFPSCNAGFALGLGTPVGRAKKAVQLEDDTRIY
jgi:hypothetical protein